MRTLQHEDLLQAFAKEKARKMLVHELGNQSMAYLLLTCGYASLLLMIKTKSNVFLMIFALFASIAFLLASYFSTGFPKRFDPHKEQIIARNDIFELLVFKRKYTLKSIKELRRQIKAEIAPNSFNFSTIFKKLETLDKSGALGLLTLITLAVKHFILKNIIFSLLYIVSSIGVIVMALLFVYNVYNSFRGNTYYEYILSILDSIIFDLENTGDNLPGKIKIQEVYGEELKELKHKQYREELKKINHKYREEFKKLEHKYREELKKLNHKYKKELKELEQECKDNS